MSEIDMTQYLDLFLQEAEEQLEILEQETLKLEREPSQERMQAIFRAAHTLKGSSRAMGFVRFAELTHEMENLLEHLRSGRLAVTTPIADALLACLDNLGAMKEKIAEGAGDVHECQELVQQLQGFSRAAEGGAAPEAPMATAKESSPDSSFRGALTADQLDLLRQAAETESVHVARVRLVPDCVMKFVRAFMAINALQESGKILLSVPDQAALEEEHFETDFEIYFSLEGELEEVRAKIASITEVAWQEVVPWNQESEVVAESPKPQAEVVEIPPAMFQTPRAEAPKEAPKPQTDGKKADTGQTVRVDVARLDELMNLVGELVIDRTRVAQIGAVLAGKYEYDTNIEALQETVGHIARITGDLQDQIMKARMLPIENVFNRFPRMVRDLANKIGKEIELTLDGGETELDRSVIEVIGDPLLHILRNSVDHGIEPPDVREANGKPRKGSIRVAARHEENHIVISIDDDGRGIDPAKVKAKALESGIVTRDALDRMSEKDALQLIFHSGLSTAEKVTDVSGRGVGMDIVRSNLTKLGGIIDLESTVGVGTRFSLRLPLTLAIIRGLLVSVNEVVYVIPLTSVIETMLLESRQIQTVHKRDVLVIRGVTTPLVRLRSALNARSLNGGSSETDQYIVIVGLAEQRIGLVVDRLIGEQEVVIKSLSRFVGDIRGISGATILGDGNVALIVDVNGVLARAA